MVSLHDNRRVTKSQGICCKEHSTSFGCFDFGWATENIWINQQWATARNAYFMLLSSATTLAFTTKYVFLFFFFMLLKCRLIRSRDYTSCPSIIVGASYMGTCCPISGSTIIKGWKERSCGCLAKVFRRNEKLQNGSSNYDKTVQLNPLTMILFLKDLKYTRCVIY